MGVDVLGVDIMGIDVLGVDFMALIPRENGSEQGKKGFLSSTLFNIIFIGSCLML